MSRDELLGDELTQRQKFTISKIFLLPTENFFHLLKIQMIETLTLKLKQIEWKQVLSEKCWWFCWVDAAIFFRINFYQKYSSQCKKGSSLFLAGAGSVKFSIGRIRSKVYSTKCCTIHFDFSIFKGFFVEQVSNDFLIVWQALEQSFSDEGFNTWRINQVTEWFRKFIQCV